MDSFIQRRNKHIAITGRVLPRWTETINCGSSNKAANNVLLT